ncbi:MAG: hypothetical protein D6707_06120, partial [Bacteroidetes bacterium]
SSTEYKFSFIAIICWLIIEFHKIGLIFIPSRYLISFLFPMGVLITTVCYEFVQNQSLPKKLIGIVMCTMLTINHFADYIQTFNNRTFQISAINDYFSSYSFSKKRPVIGAWAPSFTWKTSALTFPVWKGYFNDENILTETRPKVIVTEGDEKDSGNAFFHNSKSFMLHVDSVKLFKVKNYKIHILWMK